MNRRAKVVSGTILAVIGVVFIATNFLGGSSLHAAGVASTGYDWTQVVIWVGVFLLVGSALLFISASAE